MSSTLIDAPHGSLARAVRNFEVALLSLLFLGIVALGLTQIGLRNLADTTLPWADQAMRAGVLWLTMLGGILAAGTSQHIRIDILSRKLPERARPWLMRTVHLATALVCIALASASVQLIQLEYSLGDTAFLGIPRWTVLAIIPVGFAVMGWRFMRHALLPRLSGSSEVRP